MSMKNSNEIIGNRKQGRPACTAVPQTTELPHKGKCKSIGKAKGKSKGKNKYQNQDVPVYTRVAYRKTRFIAHSFLKSAITEVDDQLQAPTSLPSRK
jgi:hypothetical protein